MGAYISNLITLSHSYVFKAAFKHLSDSNDLCISVYSSFHHYLVMRKDQDGVLVEKDPTVTHHDLWLRPNIREKWGWQRTLMVK